MWLPLEPALAEGLGSRCQPSDVSQPALNRQHGSSFLLLTSSQNSNPMCSLQATRNEVKLLKENSCVPSQNGIRFFFFLAIFRESNVLSHTAHCTRLLRDSRQPCPVLQLCSGGRCRDASSCCSKLMPKRFLSSRKAATLEQEHF